ncbi:beta-lactamase family protein [candidate division KSB1 bacterium]|nr:beta-lactamase family protein [candidate division KSB1 bacterium]
MIAKKILILIRYGFLIILFVFAGYWGSYLGKLANIGAAYKAKILCAGVFISNRDPQTILNEDLSESLLKWVDVKINWEKKQVTASALLGLVKRTATYREGLGTTLDLNPADQNLTIPTSISTVEDFIRDWPQGEVVDLSHLPVEIDREQLTRAIEYAFTEPDSSRLKRTRAVVVVYQGRIIAERYAAGITPDTPLLGWSMTKSVVNALVGIRVAQGAFSITAPVPVSAWQKTDDPRRSITLDHLLRMSSGLEFKEDYQDLLSDVMLMLLRERDLAGFAMNKPLIVTPGTRWAYSSGTTNIIAAIIRTSFQGDDRAYLAFPQSALFQRLGMLHSVIEPDAAGTFVGSSYMYASARDWARFGLLFLQDGVWDGERILPEGWVQYSVTPTKAAPQGQYGAHWWLSPVGIPIYDPKLAARLPADLYSARGHHEQYVTILPSKKLVVVRLGLTLSPNTWNQAEFIDRILSALP